MLLLVAPSFGVLCVVRVASHADFNAPVKETKESRLPNRLKNNTKNDLFYRENKKCGAISKHAKKPKSAKKAKTVEATIICRRHSESEAGRSIK